MDNHAPFPMTKVSSLFKISWCFRESDLLLRAKTALFTIFPAPNSLVMCSMISVTAMIVDLPGKKPCCPFGKILFEFRCPMKQIKTTFTKTFEKVYIFDQKC